MLRDRELIMMLEGRRTLVWGTIAAAVFSALWLGANGGSIPRLAADTRADSRTPPALLLKRSAPAPGATSSAH
jgi:hypothetical protein